MFGRSSKIQSQKFHGESILKRFLDSTQTLGASDQTLPMPLIDAETLSAEFLKRPSSGHDHLLDDPFPTLLGKEFTLAKRGFRVPFPKLLQADTRFEITLVEQNEVGLYLHLRKLPLKKLLQKKILKKLKKKIKRRKQEKRKKLKT